MPQPEAPAPSHNHDQRTKTFLGIELSWRLSVDVHADLPKEARKYINKASRAGWLDGDAVSELSDHFRAGIAQGIPVSQLIARLGPPVAFGIQWGRVRSPLRWFLARSMAWLRRLILAGFIAYILLWASLRWAKPAPTVDYYAILNQPTLSTPPETHAWPLYRQALQDPRMHASKMLLVFTQTQALSQEEVQENPIDSLIRPGDPGWVRITNYLDDIQPLLALVHQGAQKPNLGCIFARTHDLPQEDRIALAQDPDMPLDPPPAPADDPVCRLAAGHVNEFDMPHFSTIQTLTAPITADMLYAADQSDRNRVLSNFQTLMKVSRQLRQVPVFNARTYAVGVVNRAIQRIALIAVSYPGLLHETDLADIRRSASNEMNQFTTLAPILDVQYLDRVQRAYTSDDGNGRITLDGALFLFGSLAGQDNKSITQAPTLQSRLLAECYLPLLYLTLPRQKALDAQRSQVLAGALLSDVTLLVNQKPWTDITRQPKYFDRDSGPQEWFVEMLFFGSPADLSTFGHLKSVALWQSQVQAQIDDSLLAIAQHHAHFGAYPESFAQMIPNMLSQQPIALEPGQVLLLKSTPQGPIVYSLGANGTDEGGLYIPKLPGEIGLPQGDHVYFPEHNRRLSNSRTAFNTMQPQSDAPKP